MELDEDIVISKYILRFAIVNLIITLIVTAILIVFSLDNNSLHLVMLMFSAMIVGEKFIKDNKRPPETSEKIKLIGYSFLTTWVISFFMIGIVSLVYHDLPMEIKQLLSSIPIIFIIVVFAIVSLLMVLMLWLGYGFLTNRQFKTLEKKGKL